eukprot:GFUD01085906.1.p1 GENE.GFUD01085906.1~~GFUD01085906.1.p1  ORF type:complete len:206 (-),score=53.42 GFUD01085906.1:139-756(-)
MISSEQQLIFKILIAAGLTFRTLGGLKTMEDPTLTHDEYRVSLGKDYVFFEITEPEELAYTYKANPALFTPPWNNTYNGIQLVPTEPACACGFIHNSDQIEGKIALVERGDCSFVSKVIRAQEAGAVAVVVTDQDSDNDQLFISMADDTTEREVYIPAAFVLGKNGHIIKDTLARLTLPAAVINIPVNISRIAPYRINQPPWLVW